MRAPEATTIDPGSDEWYTTISASKVPEILGLSPFRSAYELHQIMTGKLAPKPGNAQTRRGHYMERALLDWFQDQHPEHEVGPTGTWRHEFQEAWIATPDGTWGPDLIECKAVRNWWEWGKQHTAEIPPYYLAQAAWQMHVTGARRVWFPIDTAGEFREYVVTIEDVQVDLVNFIIPAVYEFQLGLRTGTPPLMDGSDSTYQAVRQLHPELDDTTLTLTEHEALAFCQAITQEKAVKADALLWKSRITERADRARKILAPDGTQLGYRSGRAGSAPSITPTAGVQKYLDAHTN